jgi:hypothetical protein
MRYRMLGTNPDTRREVSVLCLGAMLFGTVTDEATSMAILDRYAEAGGTFGPGGSSVPAHAPGPPACPAMRFCGTTTPTCGSARTCPRFALPTATWASRAVTCSATCVRGPG